MCQQVEGNQPSRIHPPTHTPTKTSPLAIAAALTGLVAASGARYGSGSASFFPPALTEGQGPRNFLLALGVFVGAAFLGKVEGQKGSWEQWM